MKLFTKKDLYKLLYEEYDLMDIKNECRREIYEKNLHSFVEDVYDLSIKIIEPLTEEQTFAFRKRYGVLDEGQVKTYHELGKELGTTHQGAHIKLKNIIDKKIPIIVYNMILAETDNLFLDENDKIEILSIPLEKVGLSPRAYNGLNSIGVSNLGNITTLTFEELSKIRAIGTKAQKEIIDKVHSYGLKLEGEAEKEQANKILEMIQNGCEITDELEEEFLNLPIESMNFSSRTFNSLKRNELNLLKDIINLSTVQLFDIETLGQKGISEVLNKVHSYKLKFADEKRKDEADALLMNLEQDDWQNVIHQFLQIPVETMGFSVRSFNALQRAEIYTIHQLLTLSYEKLSEIPNLGYISINEIQNKVHKYGEYLCKLVSEKPNIISKRDELILKYNELSIEKQELMLREAEINMEMKNIIMELCSSEKDEDYGNVKVKKINSPIKK